MADRLNIKSLLAKHGLRPKRSWSQNFLVDLGVLEAIALAAELDEEETVVELGAGLGALTYFLARDAKRVVAVDRDRDMIAVLKSEFAGNERVEILEANAAKLDWPVLVEGLGTSPVVVGNLPYHMATPIIFHLLGAGSLLDRWLVMVQREMAVRMTAQPGGRDFGVLSVMLQMEADVENVLDVPPDAFLPAPRVHSRVVRFRPLGRTRHKLRDRALFNRMVKGLFAKRRKTLRNGFRQAFGEIDFAMLDAVMERAEIDPGLRVERLSLEELARLANELAQ
ncbi:MAG: ribosomal RNA small subunit methyltransferase A [Deltaproteobacteria bacterium]|nr:ribosomal RNA small subunit methyltransferase A [Deltaproteobacteria bacterium]